MKDGKWKIGSKYVEETILLGHKFEILIAFLPSSLWRTNLPGNGETNEGSRRMPTFLPREAISTSLAVTTIEPSEVFRLGVPPAKESS